MNLHTQDAVRGPRRDQSFHLSSVESETALAKDRSRDPWSSHRTASVRASPHRDHVQDRHLRLWVLRPVRAPGRQGRRRPPDPLEGRRFGGQRPLLPRRRLRAAVGPRRTALGRTAPHRRAGGLSRCSPPPQPTGASPLPQELLAATPRRWRSAEAKARPSKVSCAKSRRRTRRWKRRRCRSGRALHQPGSGWRQGRRWPPTAAPGLCQSRVMQPPSNPA